MPNLNPKLYIKCCPVVHQQEIVLLYQTPSARIGVRAQQTTSRTTELRVWGRSPNNEQMSPVLQLGATGNVPAMCSTQVNLQRINALRVYFFGGSGCLGFLGFRARSASRFSVFGVPRA